MLHSLNAPSWTGSRAGALVFIGVSALIRAPQPTRDPRTLAQSPEAVLFLAFQSTEVFYSSCNNT